MMKDHKHVIYLVQCVEPKSPYTNTLSRLKMCDRNFTTFKCNTFALPFTKYLFDCFVCFFFTSCKFDKKNVFHQRTMHHVIVPGSVKL